MGCAGLSYVDLGEVPRADVCSKQSRTYFMDWVDVDENLSASEA
jgi:hypothetical protein